MTADCLKMKLSSNLTKNLRLQSKFPLKRPQQKFSVYYSNYLHQPKKYIYIIKYNVYNFYYLN